LNNKTGIGENLKALLDKRNISQKEFSEMLGIYQATISRYISNEREPGIATLVKMADVLDVTVEELILGEIKPIPKCKYYKDKLCVNADCPYGADRCPVTPNYETCRFARSDSSCSENSDENNIWYATSYCENPTDYSMDFYKWDIKTDAGYECDIYTELMPNADKHRTLEEARNRAKNILSEIWGGNLYIIRVQEDEDGDIDSAECVEIISDSLTEFVKKGSS